MTLWARISLQSNLASAQHLLWATVDPKCHDGPDMYNSRYMLIDNLRFWVFESEIIELCRLP